MSIKCKKLFNFRLPLAAALALVGGIIFAYLISFYNAPYYVYFTAVPVAAVIFIITVVVSKNKLSAIFCLIICCMFLIGNAYTATKLYNYGKSEVTLGTLCSVSGKVDGTGYSSTGTRYIVVTNAYADGTKLGGKVICYLGDKAGEYCDIGDSVEMPVTLEKFDAFVYGSLNYRVEDSIKYTCTVYGGLTATHHFSLFGTIRTSIYNLLYDNLDFETASVAYSMLTGDTSEMSENTLTSFRYGGIAHIFAVSGLHIGVIFAVLSFILKKIRINRWLKSGIKLGIILFYAGICGFSPSALRAVIMCTVTVVAKLLHKKYDSFNSLSISVIILLLINPFYLFGAGFVLSVGCVLGIIILSHTFNKKLIKLPKKVREGLTVGLSSQIVSYPLLLVTFGYISAAGLVLNVIVMPVLAFLYIVLLFGTILSGILFPFSSTLIQVVTLPLKAVVNFAVSMGFEKSLISGFGGIWLAVVLFLFILAFSDKVNLKKVARIVLAVSCAAVFTFTTVMQVVVPYDSLRITASAYFGGGMVIIRNSQGCVLVVTQDLSTNRLQSTLNKNGTASIDALIILGDDYSLDEYFEIDYTIPDIYLSYDRLDVDNVGDASVHYGKYFSIFGVDYKFSDGYTLKVTYQDVTIGIAAGENNYLKSVDMLFTLKQNNSCEAKNTIYFDRDDEVYGVCNIYDCGDLHFTINGGKIYETDLIPHTNQN
jgi:ComEC/Rec2-related protein